VLEQVQKVATRSDLLRGDARTPNAACACYRELAGRIDEILAVELQR
jgi:hypothetical protein